MAVLPSADSATELPWRLVPAPPLPTSLAPCWVHTPPLRVNTQTAPTEVLSPGPPTMAVLPSADTATELPWWAPPAAPVPTSLLPCWAHTPPLRVYTHTAPARLVSSCGPPTMAVLPSAETATEVPCTTFDPTAPVPTSLGPCCTKSASDGCAGPNSAAAAIAAMAPPRRSGMRHARRKRNDPRSIPVMRGLGPRIHVLLAAIPKVRRECPAQGRA